MKKEPDNLSYRAVLVLLALSSFINYIDRGNLSVAAPMLKEELGISSTQLGLLLSSFFWTYALFQIAFGWLADRFSVSWLLAIGFLLWSTATAASGLVHSLAALFAMRLILGLGEASAYPCYSKIFARHYPEQQRGFANSLVAAGTTGGSAFGLLIGATVIALVGWRSFFVGFGAITTLWLVPWFYWMPRRDSFTERDGGYVVPGLLDLLKRRSVLGTCIGLFCVNYVSYFLLTWLPFYLVRERHLSMSGVAHIGGGAFLTAGLSTAVAGRLSDRFIAAGGTPSVVRKSFMAVGQICSGVFLILSASAASGWATFFLLIGCLAYGICSSNVWAITQTIAGPQVAGRWTGLQNSIGNLAGIVAPSVTGIVVEKTGHFFLAFVITALIAFSGSAVWVFMVGAVRPIKWESLPSL